MRAGYESYQDCFGALDTERPYRLRRLADHQRIVDDIENQ